MSLRAKKGNWVGLELLLRKNEFFRRSVRRCVKETLMLSLDIEIT